MGKASYTINGDVTVTDKTKNVEAVTHTPEAGKFRTILPQILASTAKNFLLLDLGLSIAFPTIVIPALRGTLTNPKFTETLHFTDVEASWFGSIAFICQPIGSILSGWITEPLGRKRAMIVVNIPHIIAWTLLHFANSLEEMYIGAILLGLGVGFMEAPIITYVGEICQPSIRGILISCSGVAVTLGMFLVYLFGSVTDWRTSALICLSIPLITIIAICFVPETPMWLLSKNRKEDALKSLQWLRGWVSPKAVEKEFLEMQRYSNNSNRCIQCVKSNVICEHPPPTMMEKFKELKRKRTLKAFILVLSVFLVGQFSGILAMRPFMVQIFKAYYVPIDPSWATVALGIASLLANIACMCTIKLIGKRKIYLIGITGSLITCLTLGTYAQVIFPSNYNSFDKYEDLDIPRSYFPFVMYLFLAFWTNGGVTSIPWMLLSEIFPFKSRGMATGISAAINYGFGFITTKIYLNLDKGLSLNGVMWFYAVVNLLGLLFGYFLLPETENRTLEDIETHFSENNRSLTDIKIKKIDNTADVSRDLKDSSNSDVKNGIQNGKARIEYQSGCDNLAYNAN